MKVVIAIAVSYTAFWSWIGTPYRLVPNDDKYVLQVAEGKEPIRRQYFVTESLARFGYKLLKQDTLAVNNALCNGISIILIGALARRFSNRKGAIIASLIFALSSWGSSYILCWSYAPVTTMLGLLAFWLIQKRQVIAASIAIGLCFMSGPSALMICLLLAVTAPKNVRINLWIGCCVCALLWLATGNMKSYIDHIHLNADGYHTKYAFRKFGHIFQMPFLTGLWIMWCYMFALPIAILLACWHSIKTKSSTMVLVVLYLSYELLTDLLPTTKLGRAYFISFPYACILIGTSYSSWTTKKQLA